MGPLGGASLYKGLLSSSHQGLEGWKEGRKEGRKEVREEGRESHIPGLFSYSMNNG